MNIAGVLLAAGQSRRFGRDKLLYPLDDGTSMLAAAAANLRPACERLIVVTPPANEALVALLAGTDCEIVVCPEAQAGMGHSLASGVRAAAGADGWLVALADMPFILPSSHRAVAAALRAGAALAATEFQGRRGHPVGFAARWLEALTSLVGDRGGKAILDAHGQEVVPCPVDDAGVLRDIDQPGDLGPEVRARSTA